MSLFALPSSETPEGSWLASIRASSLSRIASAPLRLPLPRREAEERAGIFQSSVAQRCFLYDSILANTTSPALVLKLTAGREYLVRS